MEAESEGRFLCELTSVRPLGNGFAPVVDFVSEGGLPFCSIVLEDIIPVFFFLVLLVGGVFEELYWWIVPIVFFFVFRSGKPISVLEVDDIIIELIP